MSDTLLTIVGRYSLNQSFNQLVEACEDSPMLTVSRVIDVTSFEVLARRMGVNDIGVIAKEACEKAISTAS